MLSFFSWKYIAASYKTYSDDIWLQIFLSFFLRAKTCGYHTRLRFHNALCCVQLPTISSELHFTNSALICVSSCVWCHVSLNRLRESNGPAPREIMLILDNTVTCDLCPTFTLCRGSVPLFCGKEDPNCVWDERWISRDPNQKQPPCSGWGCCLRYHGGNKIKSRSSTSLSMLYF